MDQSRQYYHYHLKWTPDRKVQVCEGPGWLSPLFILNGPGRPSFPSQPITKAEFYALLSDLAAKGYVDNLLDF
jgi:hypothetical protein